MERTAAWLRTCNTLVVRGCGAVAVVLIAAMTGVILLQVFFRYVLNDPLSWTEEAARFMMVWMTFLVAPLAYREGLIARMSLLVDKLPATARTATEISLHGLAMALAAALFFQGLWMMDRGGAITSSALGINMRYVFAILPVSFALVLLAAAEQLLDAYLRFQAQPDAA